MVDYPSLSSRVLYERLRDGFLGPRRWLFAMMLFSYGAMAFLGCAGLWSYIMGGTAYPTPFSSLLSTLIFTLIALPIGVWWALNNFRSEAERVTHRQTAIEEDAARLQPVIAANAPTFSADDCARLAHAIAAALPLKRE